MRDGEQRLRVLVVDEHGRSVPANGLASWLRRVAPANARGTVNIALVSDRRIRSLNRTYRRKNYATDVLSFSYNAGASAANPTSRVPNPKSRVPNPFLGEIVIARGVAKRQAREAAHDEATELRVLALHGLLHLLGYDHERDDGRMARVEERLRRRGGLAAGLIDRRRPVLDTREGHRPSASGAGVGPRASKKSRLGPREHTKR